MKQINLLILVLSILSLCDLKAQQDPQYTMYMYNTMSVNPAYAGSRGHTTIVALGRTQWVGFKGAPDTETFGYDTPLGESKVGLGLNILNDAIGPSVETSLDANVSYSIETGIDSNLAFGLKLGGRLLNIDWSKGTYYPNSTYFQENISNRFLPTIGAGIYYYTDKFYAGLSVPNFLQTDHYDERLEKLRKIGEEELHYFLIAGYVFDLTEDIKFKPAALAKVVLGSPLSVDVSANFMFYERFRAGLAWRWGDAVSALVGFQINQSLYLGYAYDKTTSNYKITNSGTHELMLRYEFINIERMMSPRFF